jgi:uncharacterized membrane protein
LSTGRLVLDKQVACRHASRCTRVTTAPEELSLRQTVQGRTTIAASAGTVFECLADYKCADLFIEGLEQLTPLGPQTTGKDARFDAILNLGGRKLRTTIVITSLQPGRSITWSSADDDGQSLTFELHPKRGGTTVSLTVTYEQPGGIAGALIAPFVEHTVQHRATGALDRLRENLSPE